MSFLSGYLRASKEYFIRNRRFFLTTGIVLGAKIAASLILYLSLQMKQIDSFWMLSETGLSMPQNNVLYESLTHENRWLYLFVGWDSAWYLSILKYGYEFSRQSYAFFPGLMIASYLVDFFIRNQLVSIWVIAFSSGVLWVPVYQALSEKYMSEKEAFSSSLLFAFSPYVFVFTSLMYTEGLFLLVTLLAGLYLKKGEINKSLLFGSMSSIVRPVGFLIVLPILLKSLVGAGNKRFQDIIKGTLPLATLFGWFYYSKLSSGDWLASVNTSEWNEMYTAFTWFSSVIPENGIKALSFPIEWLVQSKLSPFFILFFMFVTPILIVGLYKTDKNAGVYSLVYYSSIMAIGTVFSYPRFFSFLFPVWMYGARRFLHVIGYKYVVPTLILLFFVVSLLLWSEFLSGTFIA